MIVKCSYCGKEIKKSPSQIHKNNFCCMNCRSLFNRKPNIIVIKENHAEMLITRNDVTYTVLIDKEDIEKVNNHKWHLHYRKKDNRLDTCTNNYGPHNRKNRYMILARYLLDYTGNLTIDHINHNTLDNRKSNLRICPIYINNLNKRNNKSGCVGVCFDKSRNKWRVMIKGINLGRFDTFEEAVKVRKDAESKYYHLQSF